MKEIYVISEHSSAGEESVPIIKLKMENIDLKEKLNDIDKSPEFIQIQSGTGKRINFNFTKIQNS